MKGGKTNAQLKLNRNNFEKCIYVISQLVTMKAQPLCMLLWDTPPRSALLKNEDAPETTEQLPKSQFCPSVSELLSGTYKITGGYKIAANLCTICLLRITCTGMEGLHVVFSLLELFVEEEASFDLFTTDGSQYLIWQIFEADALFDNPSSWPINV